MNTDSAVSPRAVKQPERLRWFLEGMDAAIKCLAASDASDMTSGDNFYFDRSLAEEGLPSAETSLTEAILPKYDTDSIFGGGLVDWQQRPLCFAPWGPDLLEQTTVAGQSTGIPSGPDYTTYYVPQIQPHHSNQGDMGDAAWMFQPGLMNLPQHEMLEALPPTEVATPSLQSLSRQRSEDQKSTSDVPEELSMKHGKNPSQCVWGENQWNAASAHRPIPRPDAAPSPLMVAKAMQEEMLPGTGFHRYMTADDIPTPESLSCASSSPSSQVGLSLQQTFSPPQPFLQPSAASTYYPGLPSPNSSELIQHTGPTSPSNLSAGNSPQEHITNSSYPSSPRGTKRCNQPDSPELYDVTSNGSKAERLCQSRIEPQTPVFIDLTQDPLDDAPHIKRPRMNIPVPTVKAQRYKAQRSGHNARWKGREAQYELVSLATRDQEAPFLWNTRLGQFQGDGEEGVPMKQILENGSVQRIYLRKSLGAYQFMLEKHEEGWTGYDLDGRRVTLRHSEISNVASKLNL